MNRLYIIIPLLGAFSTSLGNIVTEQQPAADTQDSSLPEGEQRLRSGIIMLGQICQSMAEIKDLDSAEAAVPKLMLLNEELRRWSQSFSNLPPLSEPDVMAYEERYLGTIRKINHIIEAQAGRLAAAEYYGSRNLPAVLVRLAQIAQP